ncbi:MAG: VPLPA-CTERM sorting domain-containing protein [Desulfuromonadales bacterium]|nr:VPLPA-CTERM sorting domain-containing protein [Desulfuromonadales bacterium]
MRFRACLIAVTMILAFAATSNAILIININEVGSDVVATGSGTLDLTGLSYDYATSPPSIGGVAGTLGNFWAFPDLSADLDIYAGFTGPSSFGSGLGATADSATGSFGFGILSTTDEIAVESDYVFGAPLDFTATYLSETLASLGLTIGTYEWTWAGDSIQMNIDYDPPQAPVPEPATMLLLGGGLAGLAGIRRRANKA